MTNMDKDAKKKQGRKNKFSETNEWNHERNEVAIAQKEMASQETAGLMDSQ